MVHAISLLSSHFLVKRAGVKHTVVPDGQPPTVAFTVLAQLCDPKANETDMGAILFTKNGDRRNFDLTFFYYREDHSVVKPLLIDCIVNDLYFSPPTSLEVA